MVMNRINSLILIYTLIAIRIPLSNTRFFLKVIFYERLLFIYLFLQKIIIEYWYYYCFMNNY